MRMLRTCINIQVINELVAKTSLREHPLNGPPYKFSRPFTKNLCRCGEALSARMTGVTDIHTIGHLLASESHLFGVDYDDIVAAVDVRGESRLGLATEDKSNP